MIQALYRAAFPLKHENPRESTRKGWFLGFVALASRSRVLNFPDYFFTVTVIFTAVAFCFFFAKRKWVSQKKRYP